MFNLHGVYSKKKYGIKIIFWEYGTPPSTECVSNDSIYAEMSG